MKPNLIELHPRIETPPSMAALRRSRINRILAFIGFAFAIILGRIAFWGF